MPIKAFLSSTRSDLDADCRPAALDGIHHAGATPVAMETWVVPYGDPEQICLEKLKPNSTHYGGVFAYRYGSRVPDNSKSHYRRLAESVFGDERRYVPTIVN